MAIFEGGHAVALQGSRLGAVYFLLQKGEGAMFRNSSRSGLARRTGTYRRGGLLGGSGSDMAGGGVCKLMPRSADA